MDSRDGVLDAITNGAFHLRLTSKELTAAERAGDGNAEQLPDKNGDLGGDTAGHAGQDGKRSVSAVSFAPSSTATESSRNSSNGGGGEDDGDMPESEDEGGVVARFWVVCNSSNQEDIRASMYTCTLAFIRKAFAAELARLTDITCWRDPVLSTSGSTPPVVHLVMPVLSTGNGMLHSDRAMRAQLSAIGKALATMNQEGAFAIEDVGVDSTGVDGKGGTDGGSGALPGDGGLVGGAGCSGGAKGGGGPVEAAKASKAAWAASVQKAATSAQVATPMRAHIKQSRRYRAMGVPGGSAAPKFGKKRPPRLRLTICCIDSGVLEDIHTNRLDVAEILGRAMRGQMHIRCLVYLERTRGWRSKSVTIAITGSTFRDLQKAAGLAGSERVDVWVDSHDRVQWASDSPLNEAGIIEGCLVKLRTPDVRQRKSAAAPEREERDALYPGNGFNSSDRGEPSSRSGTANSRYFSQGVSQGSGGGVDMSAESKK